MKLFLDKTIVSETLESIRCNKCGRSIEKNVFGYFEDHLSISKTWGYGTPLDGETHEFDLCMDCYTEITGLFDIPPELTAGNPVEYTVVSKE